MSELSWFEVSTVVLLNIQAFWDVMSDHCKHIYTHFKDNVTVPSFQMSALSTCCQHNIPADSNLELIFRFTHIPYPNKEQITSLFYQYSNYVFVATSTIMVQNHISLSADTSRQNRIREWAKFTAKSSRLSKQNQIIHTSDWTMASSTIICILTIKSISMAWQYIKNMHKKKEMHTKFV